MSQFYFFTKFGKFRTPTQNKASTDNFFATNRGLIEAFFSTETPFLVRIVCRNLSSPPTVYFDLRRHFRHQLRVLLWTFHDKRGACRFFSESDTGAITAINSVFCRPSADKCREIIFWGLYRDLMVIRILRLHLISAKSATTIPLMPSIGTPN